MKKKEKIPYSDELADAIIEENGLRPQVKKVWKTRGTIPGDYLDENRDTSAKITDRDPEYQKFKEILNRPEIAATKFRSLNQKGADVQRSKDRMTEAERIHFKTEITEIRNKLRAAKDSPTAQNLYHAVTDIRLHPTKFISNQLYKKIKEKSILKDYEIQEAKFAILALYNQIKI